MICQSPNLDHGARQPSMSTQPWYHGILHSTLPSENCFPRRDSVGCVYLIYLQTEMYAIRLQLYAPKWKIMVNTFYSISATTGKYVIVPPHHYFPKQELHNIQRPNHTPSSVHSKSSLAIDINNLKCLLNSCPFIIRQIFTAIITPWWKSRLHSSRTFQSLQLGGIISECK